MTGFLFEVETPGRDTRTARTGGTVDGRGVVAVSPTPKPRKKRRPKPQVPAGVQPTVTAGAGVWVDDSPVVAVVVYGTPGPQGSKSFKGLNAKGNAILVESSKKVKPWRQAVVDSARIACNATAKRLGFAEWVALDGPLEVSMVFTLQKPTSAPKRTRTWPTKYPDVSKLCRSTEDALTVAGVWADDARVVRYRDLAKVFPGEDPAALSGPGVTVKIWRVCPGQPVTGAAESASRVDAAARAGHAPAIGGIR